MLNSSFREAHVPESRVARGADRRANGPAALAFCLAYRLLVVLWGTAVGQAARRDLEILRRVPRHGTTQTQSILSIGDLRLYHPRHAARAGHALGVLLRRVARGGALFPVGRCRLPVATGAPGN